MKKVFMVLHIATLIILLPGTLGYLWLIGKPEPMIIAFPNVKGRILEESLVKPGTFTVTHPFEEVGTWGDDTITRWRVMNEFETGTKFSPKLVWESWRPDKINGVFQYASHTVETNWPRIYSAVATKIKGREEVLVTPIKNEILGETTSILGAIWVMLLILLVYYLPTPSKT